MSKILISFLGTGALAETGNDRKYRTASYQFADGREFNTSFVADALAQYYMVDKVILIGTVKSMWEEVYETFSNMQNKQIDENYYVELAEYCSSANHKTPLHLPDVEKLESVLGIGSKIVLVYYGLNENELMDNAGIILGIEKFVNRGDELIVDITHSFRSLPLYMMNLLVYLRNVSQKQIAISHITYGMVEVARDLKYAPIVELTDILRINDWIIGAHSFLEYGNGYMVSRLMENQGQKDVATRIRAFSNYMNLNHLVGIKSQISSLRSMKNIDFDSVARNVIPSAINNFTNSFPKTERSSSFQFSLAKWQFEHCNFASSFLALMESIISYVCESMGTDADDYNARESAKVILKAKGYCREQSKINNYKEIRKVYFSIKNYRNSIAHNISTESNAETMIRKLSNAIDSLSKYYE